MLGAIALVTLLVVAFAGLTHPYAPLAHTLPGTLTFGPGIAALGTALVITLYDYGGYGDVCALGDEVIAPARTIPRSIVLVRRVRRHRVRAAEPRRGRLGLRRPTS